MGLVANARMYAVTPDAAAAWSEIFAWVAARTGLPLATVPHAPPLPLATLWTRDDLGCAFMCGRPWTRAVPRPIPIARPLPSPERYGGAPQYMTDLVVRADGGFATLEDTFGHRVGYTLEESQSGFAALRRHLLAYRSAARPSLYAASVGPLGTPRAIVEALVSGAIDVGPLDSYCHDLMRSDPDHPVHRLRTVATTEPAPIPLLVASPGTPDAVVGALREAFAAVAEDPGLAGIRARLLLGGFAPVEASDYDVLLEHEREAIAAGYGHPR